jgi:hypothetical protein
MLKIKNLEPDKKKHENKIGQGLQKTESIQQLPLSLLKVGTDGYRRLLTLKGRFINLTLYASCIILQYVYKPTRCTKFL